MALLSLFTWRQADDGTKTRGGWWLLVLALAFALGPSARAQTAVSSEYQIKAVYLFNFAQFVDWPATAFPTPETPLVIGILGKDPFDGSLEEAVRGETVNHRPLVVRRYNRVEDVFDCHVLFISRSETDHLSRIFTALKGRNILTVGEVEGFADQGGMIRFITEKNRVRFKINVGSAKAASLTISSKLLRPAEVIDAGKG
jgi:hypothetical protein